MRAYRRRYDVIISHRRQYDITSNRRQYDVMFTSSARSANPADAQRWKDVVLTSLRCDDVTYASIRRHFDVMCLLGSGYMVSKWHRIDVDATSSRRIDVNTTSFYVMCPLGSVWTHFLLLKEEQLLWLSVTSLAQRSFFFKSGGLLLKERIVSPVKE